MERAQGTHAAFVEVWFLEFNEKITLPRSKGGIGVTHRQLEVSQPGFCESEREFAVRLSANSTLAVGIFD
jgi:hypothetical protein